MPLTPTCEGAFSGPIAPQVALSPLGNFGGCTSIGKVNLSGRRRSRQAAKDPFLKALLTGSCALERVPTSKGIFSRSQDCNELIISQKLINLLCWNDVVAFHAQPVLQVYAWKASSGAGSAPENNLLESCRPSPRARPRYAR